MFQFFNWLSKKFLLYRIFQQPKKILNNLDKHQKVLIYVNMDYKKLLPIIGIIILIFIVATLDLNKIYNVFSLINPIYSFICFFAILPIVMMVNIQWQILLKKQKIKVSFLYSLKNIFIGYFYGFISPGGIGAYT